ncbi:hypothetical protein FWD07_00150 [Candidatus Saccharibacteria bacterium]|nr:hypothetical protein [Candidatus Saccharibacteria bacterium]
MDSRGATPTPPPTIKNLLLATLSAKPLPSGVEISSRVYDGRSSNHFVPGPRFSTTIASCGVDSWLSYQLTPNGRGRGSLHAMRTNCPGSGVGYEAGTCSNNWAIVDVS